MFVAMVGTLLIRIPVAVFSSDWEPGPWLAHRLGALAPAASSALLVSIVASSGGALRTPTVDALAAVGVTVAVMRWRGQLALALAAGLLAALVVP